MEISLTNPYSGIHSVAVIGNYLPRKCGIATFTSDLVATLSTEAQTLSCWAMVMNDRSEGYDYPEKVRFEVGQNNLADYRTAAEFLNFNQADVVCLQHEYGIFGGTAGSHILKLLGELRMPVVTTLHTVLIEPTEEYEKVMVRLADLSDRLVVMSNRAVDILHSLYDIPEKKIVHIPHGIPDMPFVDPNYYKDQYGLIGKKVLLTFGLLSRNKGIEYVLRGLPEVVKRFPDVFYIVLGATHPHVVKDEGERYRLELQQLVNKLNLQEHVMFQNRFVSLGELCEYLAAADIYITPYTHEDQITSGTLAYAMGSGNVVISTPYWYAEEMLGEGRGQLVPFRDEEAMARVLTELLADDIKRHQMRKHAYDFSRSATWKEVARRYLEVFREVRQERSQRPRPVHSSHRAEGRELTDLELPELKLDHLITLTDDNGVLQHAKYTVADRYHGYCTDDNARALIVAVQARDMSRTDPAQLDLLCGRYLAFLHYAFDPENGRFRNFMNYARQWLEPIGSEDSHGRALWGLGMAVSLLGHNPQHLHMTSTLFRKALPAIDTFTSPRAIAFALIGMQAYLENFSGDSEVRRYREVLTERLFAGFEANAGNDWPWLENELTYANGKLPHALLVTGRQLQRDDLVERGLRVLEWLINVQKVDGHLAPVGNYGWYVRNGEKARFDQQPIEANALLEACIAAFHASGDKVWIDRSLLCFNWFLGHNDLNLPLYDARTGGCRDSLQSDGANQNEGAESTLAWLLSLAAMYRLMAEQVQQPRSMEKSGRVTSGG